MFAFARGSWRGSGWPAGGLVVVVWVEGEFAHEFAGAGVDDADIEVLDEHDDVGSGVGPADADVVEPSLVAEGEGAGFADDVGADPVVGVGGPVAGGGLGPGGIGGGRCLAVRQGAVRPVLVVVAGEDVEQGLKAGEVGGLRGLGGQPLLQGLPEPLDFALGLRVVRAAVFCCAPRRRSSFSRPLRPPLPPENRVVNTMPLSVSVEAGAP